MEIEYLLIFVIKKYKIKDEAESYSEAIISEKNLKKIKVFWNSSIMNYSLTGKLLIIFIKRYLSVN